MARSGYTLPVFAVAAAKAALLHLLENDNARQSVALNLLPETAEIAIVQVAVLNAENALAITVSDPGDNLDLTRHTPVWAWVTVSKRQSEALVLHAGEGLGRTALGEPAIYSYARRLFEANLLSLIPVEQTVAVTIILPEGRQLAKRTSNEAFGILEGLSLLDRYQRQIRWKILDTLSRKPSKPMPTWCFASVATVSRSHNDWEFQRMQSCPRETGLEPYS
jgi:cobalt-precorrin-5B (C1)-methyltransferase